jgi:excisionase family DNA binding protein
MIDKTTHDTAPSTAFLTQEEVAKMLRVSQRHVANLQRKGLLPYLRLGRRVIYERTRLMKALDAITARTAKEVLG